VRLIVHGERRSTLRTRMINRSDYRVEDHGIFEFGVETGVVSFGRGWNSVFRGSRRSAPLRIRLPRAVNYPKDLEFTHNGSRKIIRKVMPTR
jgi:hypothetical protein